MKLLLVGHGSREHALAKELRREGNELSSFQTKPNVGLNTICTTSKLYTNYNTGEIVRFAKKIKAQIIVVGHEEPIFNGISEAAENKGIPCYAPTSSAARLEFDRKFARSVVGTLFPSMIPSATSLQSMEEVYTYLKTTPPPIVIKTPKYFQAKSTQIIRSEDSGHLEHWVKKYLEVAGSVIIEKFIDGKEFSVYGFSDGRHLQFPIVVRDYPFKLNSDRGEKTGGMGSVSCGKLLPYVTTQDFRLASNCIEEVLRYMEQTEGVTYKGVIVGQFIKTPQRIYFNEFDVRPGDSETINLVETLKCRLTDIISSTLEGDLSQIKIGNQSVVCICHVPHGYPLSPSSQRVSLPKELLSSNSIYFGDTSFDKNGNIVSGVSRTLVVVGRGKELETARLNALHLSKKLNVGLFYRTDIGDFSKVNT